MQNKGAIRFVAIMFALVCLYQLWFTVKTSQVEKKAKEYAQGDIRKMNGYLDSVATKPVYNFLWIKEFTYRDVKERELNLGLDLKGGMNVILEVSVVDVIRSLSNYNTDTTFNRAIELAKKKQVKEGGQSNFVTLFGQAFNEIDPNGKLAAIFNTIELKDQINFSSTNEEVLAVLTKEAESAISNSFNILRNRIDKFGVTQPNIQRLGNSGRILVELPGVKEPERVRKLLQGTANLEFWETYDNTEVVQNLYAANTKIKEINDAKKVLEGTASTGQKTGETVAETKKSDDALSLIDQLASDSTKVDTTKAPDMTKDYPLFSVLQPRFSRDNQPLPGASVGIAHFKDTSKVNQMLSIPQVKALFPRNLKFLWGVKAIDAGEQYFELYAIKITSRDGRAALEGDVVTDARKEYAQGRGTAEVAMSMNQEGAKVWARLTGSNVGRAIAIVLDDNVYSAPNVNQEIKGGRSSITGGFTVEEAEDLANILKSGKMPAPAVIEQETIVGPSLGKEAISKGLWSFVFSFIAVILFMVAYYSKAGWAANIAVFVNVFFIMGVLASLGAVLTLPGIAGIVLTLAMAVDANVLINERVREELEAGKGIKQAIKDGYSNAYSSIIDSNLTTLLTGLILGYFGKGPIHGFAVTLCIGIVSSMFSAIFITRLIFERQLSQNKIPSFSNKYTVNAFKGIKFDWLGNRKYYYIFSGLMIAVSLFSIVTRGFNSSVDFTGGRTYVVRFEKPVETTEIQNALRGLLGGDPEVKTYGADNQVKITTMYLINSSEAPAADVALAKSITYNNEPSIEDVVEAKIFSGLKDNYLPAGTTFEQYTQNFRKSSEKVGPTIASDIKTAAVWAVILSLIGIFVYIVFRFRNMQMGLGGLVSLAHDVIFVLGAYSLLKDVMPFSMSIDQAFIASILTVVGYSINDTVVVYDRIREYRGLHPKWSQFDTMNDAINHTLSRTMITSGITIMVLLIMFIFGGEIIRGFIFAMLIGIFVGTYSSVAVASTVTYDTLSKEEKKKNT